MLKIIGQVAASDVTVMVTGESGTGRKIGGALHLPAQPRANRPFMAVNLCGHPG